MLIYFKQLSFIFFFRNNEIISCMVTMHGYYTRKELYGLFNTLRGHTCNIFKKDCSLFSIILNHIKIINLDINVHTNFLKTYSSFLLMKLHSYWNNPKITMRDILLWDFKMLYISLNFKKPANKLFWNFTKINNGLYGPRDL